jgi:hypothetical protein
MKSRLFLWYKSLLKKWLSCTLGSSSVFKCRLYLDVRPLKGAAVVKDGDYVAIFNSIHRVMEAERLLKGLHLTILLIPAPRALAADCGLAIRYAEDVRREVEDALGKAGLMPRALYRKNGEDFEKLEGEL